MAYEVGYKKPPEHSQWQKGDCPNPGGRPSRSRRANDESALWDLVNKVLYDKVSATGQGKKKKITHLELLMRKTLKNAFDGDTKALSQLLSIAEKAHRADQEGAGNEPVRIIVTGGLPDK